MKNKIFILIILLLIFNFNNSYAATTEEDTCINQLSKEIKNDNRFIDNKVFKNNKGLKNILYDEVNNSYIDISKYSSFTGYLVTNPASIDTVHQDLINNNGFTDKDFIARRTNIATVVASGSFVVSNIVGFGRDSNFTFPLSANSGNSYGDSYKLNGIFFKEYVVYTHHSYAGDFLSCGIVHVKPASGRSYTNIDENGYKTNVLTGNNCSSGFLGSNLNKNGFNFYKMKTDVCVTDYTDKDYLKMEVLSLAFQNNSTYFSDYVAYNLQVQAMKDLTNQAKGLWGIRQIFLRYLVEGTCLELTHPTGTPLPSFCSGQYSDTFNLSGINISDINAIAYDFNYSKNKNIALLFDGFLPEANASRVFKNMDQKLENARGIAVLDNIPYDLYIKLQNIKDTSFKNYLMLSVSPGLEKLIENRIDNDIVISPYEDVFLKCNIKYPEREKIVIDFLTNLKDISNIDFSNLNYSNPKFGDCIIPYPDKENINKEINLSFESNKLLAKKIKGIYKYPELTKESLDYIKKEKLITSEYEKKINIITKKFNSNKISGEELNKILINEKEIYDVKIKTIYKELENIEKKKVMKKKVDINNSLTDLNKKTNNFDVKTILIIISLFLVGTLILFLSIRKKK